MNLPRAARALGVMAVAAAGAAGVLGACSGGEPPRRDCRARVWLEPGAGAARVIGSWNDWAEPGLAPVLRSDGWQLLELDLPAGEHGYLLVDASGARLDPLAPLGTWRGEEPVSLLVVGDCTAPELRVERVDVVGAELEVVATFLASEAGSALDAESVAGDTREGAAAAVVEADPATGRLVVRAPAGASRKIALALRAADEHGALAGASAAGWTDPASGPAGARDGRDEVLYQVLTDRFRADGGAPLAAPASLGARAGGTLGGVESAVADGTFASLGVTALWLSPVYPNPSEALDDGDGHPSEGYHGYWPAESRAVESRIGGEAALDALVARAHAAGLSVLLDLVPNHVYATHPRYLEHPEWFEPAGCVCGTATCPWAEFLESCWFTPFLPDVHWPAPGVMAATLDDALFWVRRFDVDGFRVDAVPMMPRAATRRIADSLRRATAPRAASFVVGEVYTGPGLGAVDTLAYYLGPAGLDAVFDFPLLWAMVDVIARGQGSFGAIESVLAYEDERLAGSGAVLGRMLGNHDTPRFVSLAAGDGGGDPWSAPATQPTASEPYERLALGHALVFTLPGMPVVYQGDEVGLAGAGDPDCRRPMPAESELSEAQRAVRTTVVRLARLRRCSDALRRGERTPLVVAGEHYAFARGGERPVVVALSTSAAPVSFTLPGAGVAPGAWRDVVSGEDVEADGDPLPMTLAPRSFRVLLRADDPCVASW